MFVRRSLYRRGITVLEVAITAPVAMFVVIGLMVGGLGTFRYQQVAALAREGASYASLHGPYYAKRTGQPMATSTDVMKNAILPVAAGLDTTALHCDLSYDTNSNTATVRVTYDWLPESLLPAAKLSSTSGMLIE